MEEPAATSEGDIAHFPPGSAAPTAAERAAARLKTPEHLAKLNEGKAAFYALSKEERRGIIEGRRAEKAARKAAREAKRAAKNGTTPAPPPDSVPPTVRSGRAAEGHVPDSSVPHRAAAMLGPLRGLIDLCAALPDLGLGTCFIQVTRLKPTTAFGVATAGVQKPLFYPCDDAEFAQAYGGAEYSLRGYALGDNGKARALTEPVTYRVSGPPNLDATLTEDDAMRPNPAPPQPGHPAFRRPGIVTPQAADAEARIHSRTLDHEERLRQDRTAQRREERREAEEREAARRDGDLNVAKLISEDKEREMQRLREMQEQQLALARQPSGPGLGELASVIKAMKPDGEATQELLRQHAGEMRQISESHKEELLRLNDQHRAELQRLGEAHTVALHRVEDTARQERERSEKLTRDTEQRASEQVREAERRADQRVTDTQNVARSNYEELRTRSEERIRDQNDSWTRRFDDLRSSHDREMRQKESEINLMRSNLEGNMAVILSGKDNEIKRLQHDLREARAQAEENKDWVGKMSEFESTAEKMGFSKGEGGGEGSEDDLKTMALKAGVGLLGRLPELVQNAGDAIAKVRNPGVPPDVARSQARSGMVRGSMRTVPRTMAIPPPVPFHQLTFATEDGGYTPPPDAAPPRSMPPPITTEPTPLPPLDQSPSVALAQPFAPLAPEQQVAVPQAMAQLPPQQQAAAAPPAPPPVAPAPAAVVTASAPPPSSLSPPHPTEGLPELDAMAVNVIQQFTPRLALDFEQRRPPTEVAQQILADIKDPAIVRLALSSITVDQLIQAISQSPGEYGVLVTRNGQKFLREVWRLTANMVGDGAD